MSVAGETGSTSGDAAKGIGPSGRVAVYQVPDTDMATGSTLGGPKVCMVIKATGAIEKVYSIEIGEVLVGTVVLRHYDQRTGMYLAQPHAGTFIIHPEHQQHHFDLESGVEVREDLFALSSEPQEGDHDVPPGVYYMVELENPTDQEQTIVTYAFAELRGNTAHDVQAEYDAKLHALVAWNKSAPEHARLFGCSEPPASYETTSDTAKALAMNCPGPLSNQTPEQRAPLGAFELRHTLPPKGSAAFSFIISFSGEGRAAAGRTYRALPKAEEALRLTKAHYSTVLNRCVVLTPSPQVNHGVLWAKANMLRIQTKAPTGWCFVNDPTRSNNSVARDTCWMGYGADYVTPEFAREALLAYVRLQEKSGEVIEYYDIRTGKTADYGLNINDNTPLLILALWHHYSVSGDRAFLQQVYPAAAKAARYIVSQENEQGLVWCTATGTSDWGIVGWRNVIKNYRLSGATTEVNSECYAALTTAAEMARVLEQHDDSAEFGDAAGKLREAINSHLYNPDNGLYYLNIDLDGTPRSDITSDLVFPVMFGVATRETAARIIARLSNADFWTAAGMRTSPRDAPYYTPDGGWGLLGGVWVGVTFWYAFAAAPYSPEFMDHALSTSFHNYSRSPRRSNTVPGQFSEWLDGETLVNQGMMLSPWFPPRYVWAAIEGTCGFKTDEDALKCWPNLAPQWKWLGVQNLPYRGQSLTFFAVRQPEVQLYANFHFQESSPYVAYDEDVSAGLQVTGDAACALGLRQGSHLLLFVGNTEERTVTTALTFRQELQGAYRCRIFDSLMNRWQQQDDLLPGAKLRSGITVQLERRGFCLYDLQQER